MAQGEDPAKPVVGGRLGGERLRPLLRAAVVLQRCVEVALCLLHIADADPHYRRSAARLLIAGVLSRHGVEHHRGLAIAVESPGAVAEIL